MKHTNQLIHSKSPYLLQHAHNPVNWFMWTDEVLQKAIDEDKPILVSIGYSSCHWCHVMERESFENEETAELMNELFINIKIDREERPDLDHIYMDALQAMTGSGGWPLNVFLTPQLQPFYGGTYFPPIAAYGRMSWQDTLKAVSKAYSERKDEINNQAQKLTNHLNNSNSFSNKINIIELKKEDEDAEFIAENILKNADIVWGGFGNAPKFPQTFSIKYLLRQYHFSKLKGNNKKLEVGKENEYEKYLKQATLSLDKMVMGGLYDHVGGGFARYSTDEKWFAPHFEKMLYDNALIIDVLCEAYQVTENELYKKTIVQTLQFIEREMMSDEFGFYSALDADSEGVEGKFYTWQKSEIDELLGADSKLFCELYNVTEHGNWEETNILWLTKSIEEFALEQNLNSKEVEYVINSFKDKLLAEREKRIRPLLDDKILCSWNALMNIAYCKAYAATGNEHYKNIAIKNVDFILSKLIDNNQLFHCYKTKPYNNAFLDDYAYLIDALIHIHEITANTDYLIKAKDLLDEVIEGFSDDDEIYFYYTSKNQKNIISKKIEVYDGATPSANAVLCKCLQKLAVVFDDENLRKRYLLMLSKLSDATIKYPTSFGCWATILQKEIYGINELVVIGKIDQASIWEMNQYYLPNKLYVLANTNNFEKIPVLTNKIFSDETLFYLCKNQSCLPPENSFKKILGFF